MKDSRKHTESASCLLCGLVSNQHTTCFKFHIKTNQSWRKVIKKKTKAWKKQAVSQLTSSADTAAASFHDREEEEEEEEEGEVREEEEGEEEGKEEKDVVAPPTPSSTSLPSFSSKNPKQSKRFLLWHVPNKIHLPPFSLLLPLHLPFPGQNHIHLLSNYLLLTAKSTCNVSRHTQIVYQSEMRLNPLWWSGL